MGESGARRNSGIKHCQFVGSQALTDEGNCHLTAGSADGPMGCRIVAVNGILHRAVSVPYGSSTLSWQNGSKQLVGVA